MSANKVAVVVNGNNIFGQATVKVLCKNFKCTVYFTATSEDEGLEAVKKFKENGLFPKFLAVQTTDTESVKKFAIYIRKEHNGVDILVNNTPDFKENKDSAAYEEAKSVINEFYRSLLIVEECLFPLLRDGARVVNITSACGHHSSLKNDKWIKTLIDPDLNIEQIDEIVTEYLESVKNGTCSKNWFVNDGRSPEYKIAMVALTALTFVWQKKYYGRNISVNAVYPGSLLNSEDAEKSAEVIRYLVFDASSKIKGTFMWHNKKLVDWYDTENDYSCEL